METPETSLELSVQRRLTPALEPAFYERLLSFYGGRQEEDFHFSETWQFVTGGFERPLIAALESKEIPALAGALGTLYSDKTMYGLDSSIQYLDEYDLGLGDPEHLTEEHFRTLFLQLLHLVAVSSGSIPAFNPEQEKECITDFKADLAAVETAIGFPMNHSGGGNISGVLYEDRFIPHKLLDAACTAISLKRLPCWKPGRVLEIGAGAGWIAYLLHRMAVESYHILDLPVVAVMQAYMLATALGPSPIWLAGETLCTSGSSIFIHGLTGEVESLQFDLVINQNSFPELTVKQQADYVSLMERVIRPGGCFFSINHEASVFNQHRAFQAMAKSTQFRQIQRSPHWLRAGWLEEVWQRV